MTLDELISELETAREDMGGDAEVRVAHNENWPVRATVARVTTPTAPDADYLYSDDERAYGQDEDGNMVWLATDSAPYSESPYAPKWAWTGDFAEAES
jgi:hypothetical protein